jgi:hypothetical protein
MLLPLLLVSNPWGCKAPCFRSCAMSCLEAADAIFCGRSEVGAKEQALRADLAKRGFTDIEFDIDRSQPRVDWLEDLPADKLAIEGTEVVRYGSHVDVVSHYRVDRLGVYSIDWQGVPLPIDASDQEFFYRFCVEHSIRP